MIEILSQTNEKVTFRASRDDYSGKEFEGTLIIGDKQDTLMLDFDTFVIRPVIRNDDIRWSLAVADTPDHSLASADEEFAHAYGVERPVEVEGRVGRAVALAQVVFTVY